MENNQGKLPILELKIVNQQKYNRNNRKQIEQNQVKIVKISDNRKIDCDQHSKEIYKIKMFNRND